MNFWTRVKAAAAKVKGVFTKTNEQKLIDAINSFGAAVETINALVQKLPVTPEIKQFSAAIDAAMDRAEEAVKVLDK